MNALKENIKSAVTKQGVIAIIRGVDEDNLAPLLGSLFEGGVCVAEITFGFYSEEKTARLIQKAVSLSGENIILGAGTVTCLERAKIAKESGAKFIVSPNFNREVVEFCVENDLFIVCGAFSPTEIYDAYSCGADLIKVFPANAFGVEYIKAIKGPLKEIPLVVFGGVTAANIGDYIKAGAIGAGIGSELINLKAINDGDFEFIKNKAQELISCVKEAK